MESPSLLFDRTLFDLLKKEKLKIFTTYELRDAYAATLKGADFKLADLRLYVYEEIRRMIRVGWVVPDKQKKSRGQIFHLQSQPARHKIMLFDDGFLKWMNGEKRPTGVAFKMSAQGEEHMPTKHPTEIHRLESLMKAAQLDLLVSVGEAERYKQLMTDFPEIKDRIENPYLMVRDQGSRLLGHLRAIENTLKILSNE